MKRSTLVGTIKIGIICFALSQTCSAQIINLQNAQKKYNIDLVKGIADEVGIVSAIHIIESGDDDEAVAIYSLALLLQGKVQLMENLWWKSKSPLVRKNAMAYLLILRGGKVGYDNDYFIECAKRYKMPESRERLLEVDAVNKDIHAFAQNILPIVVKKYGKDDDIAEYVEKLALEK